MENSFFSDFIGPFPDVLWEPAFLTPAQQAELLEFCLDEIQWQTKMASWGGRLVEFPRQLAWFGDVPYAYSGILHQPLAMPTPLRGLRQRIEAYLRACGAPTDLNSVLLNRYRSGNDSIGMHSDDETQLGPQPVIASISLGDSRTFVFEHKKTGMRHKNSLPGGSLLVMKGDCQDEWRHGIFKEPGASSRVNLTFRRTLQ